MWQLLQIEIYKIFKRRRTYIAFGAIAAIILLIQVALKFGGDDYIDLALGGIKENFDIRNEEVLNGYFVCFIILNLLLVHVPILVALVAGDTVAGEANMGTLRLLVSRPVSRTNFLLVKFMAVCFYTIILLVWVAILSLFVSMLIFGTNQLVVPKEAPYMIIAESDILWRYLAAFFFAAAGLITVAALSFLFSVFADNAIGPIVATVCVIIVFTILTQMQIPFYDNTIKPYLFTTHMLGWKGFFYIKGTDENVSIRGSIENFSVIMQSLAILIGYSIAFVITAILVFRKKDILS
jgi:ABC-2 type transport system permease protein